ncbi:Oxysterol-binding protein [Gorgonomyces haynaldii]|nr:Oxysterol-binding protein [Gorgonomyces haynaldii]
MTPAKEHHHFAGVPNAITRRTKLPAPAVSMEGFSFLGILRNNVGKDLSTVAMPIILNEPINLLQKLCEELEYSYLLDKAAATTDPVERLATIAGFVVSGFASSVHRAARKPFNPLLGETFEYDCPEKGFRYISEKVSHRPPIMAAHCESKNYVYHQDSLLKTSFWGKSMELTNTGTVHLKFPHLSEHYVWNKVTTSMRNVFSSNRYLEHHGTMKILSLTTGHHCQLTFKESGYFTSANNEVSGDIYSPSNQKLVSLTGQWDHSLSKFLPSNPNALEVIWRANPFPPDHEQNYSLPLFSIQLNELLPQLTKLIPNTDTRYRPDQRLYEEGNVNAAEQEKQRLEQKQREFRKLLEANGTRWTPEFFELQDDELSEGGKAWVYKGNYWNRRGQFEHKLDLYS